MTTRLLRPQLAGGTLGRTFSPTAWEQLTPESRGGWIRGNQELHNALVIEDWSYEKEKLGDLASDFHEVLQKAAETYAPGSEHVQRRRTVTDIYRGAKWPDEQPGEDRGDENVGRELLQEFAEAIYPEVGNGAVGDGAFILNLPLGVNCRRTQPAALF